MGKSTALRMGWNIPALVWLLGCLIHPSEANGLIALFQMELRFGGIFSHHVRYEDKEILTIKQE